MTLTPPKSRLMQALERYGVAVLSVAVGYAFRLLFQGVLGQTVPYITFFPSVMFAAWYGGLGPGILATILSVAAAVYFVIPPATSLRLPTSADVVGAVLFLGVCTFISILNETLRNSRATSEQRLQDLTQEIIRRTRVEQTLADSRRDAERARDLLQTTLASIGDAVIATDAKGRVTFLNAVAVGLTGWSQAEAAGVAVTEVFAIRHEKTEAAVESPVDQALREGSVVRLANHTVLAPKGGRAPIPIEDSAAPIRDQDGRLLGAVLVFRDVTARRQSAVTLEQQWHTFDTALSHTPDFTYVFDLQGRFTYVNRALLSLWQKPLEEAVGKDFFDLGYPTDLAARLQRQIQQVIDTSAPVRDQTPFTGPTGETRQYEYIFVPVLGEGGKVEAVAGSTRDTTDRVRVEEALRESQDRLRAIYDGTYEYMGLMAPDGTLLDTNRASLEFAGNTREEVVGRPFWDGPWFIATPGAPEMVREGVARAAAGEFVRFEATVRRPSGECPTIDVSFHPIRNQRGEVAFIVPEGRDITDLKRTEEDLRRSNQELTRANRELEEFAYVASHDLQEPLRMVNIYTQLVLKDLRLESAEVSQYAGFVRDGVLRMEALIHDLLTFSRAVHVDELPVGTADLGEALDQALAVLKNRIEEQGASVAIEGPLPAVRGDTAQLSHVFQNLLSNALKYRREDAAPAIRIRAEASGANWTVSVGDNGIGFEQQYAERIFGLFKRLHKEEFPGTGLGLAICKRIVERYGGRIWAEGRPGRGATFYFSLPRAEGPFT